MAIDFKPDEIDRQNAEFDALVKLSEQWTVLSCVAVVDDDYPYFRRRYESAIREFIAAIRNNGRIE